MTFYVITGPPAAGKSTYVREHAQPGDITIDYDTLAQALSPTPASDPAEYADPHPQIVAVTLAARDAALNEATEWTGCDTYLIHAMPARQDVNRYRKHGYEIITIDPGYTECMRRAQAERTPRQVDIVRDWYQRRGLA